MSGALDIVGLGPADARWLTREAQEALEAAQDIIGYAPYVARVPERVGQTRLASDNRVEIDRAQEALARAAQGRRVAVVSGGDPGVFAMAAAVFEAVDGGPRQWRDLDIHVLPGVSAMQAAAARLGAPLGHDFCAISLSDNLKPWDVIAKRLEHAAQGDFVIALYNPASRARPTRITDAFALLRRHLPGETFVGLAKSVGRENEEVILTRLDEADGRQGRYVDARRDRRERHAPNCARGRARLGLYVAESDMSAPWLSLIGLGEDGADALTPAARALVAQASLIVGGARHLAMIDAPAERLQWPSPLTDAMPRILAQRGKPTVVLASGDPFFYGVGDLIGRHVARDEIFCVPAPSAFSLAAARLKWSQQDCALLSLHGRAFERVTPHLQPRARIIALSWDETTPAHLARHLVARGMGESRLYVLERLGGPLERVRHARADGLRA